VTPTGLGFMHDRKSTGQAFQNTPCTRWSGLASELACVVDLDVEIVESFDMCLGRYPRSVRIC
jgi:hypothetical protein